MFSATKFGLMLFGLSQLLKFSARRYPAFAARLKQRNLVAQIKARDEGIGYVGGCCGCNAAYIRSLARGVAEGR